MKKLSMVDARHLIARVSLGQNWISVNSLIGKTRQESVHYLLRPIRIKTPPAPPFKKWSYLNLMSKQGGKGKHQARVHMMRGNDQIKFWSISNLLTTNNPVNERMVLFWQNHFTSSLDKVENPQLIYRQSQFFRKNALGNFSYMLRHIIKDPAMLVYLDGALNIKGKANENFSRELLEMFTLGKGHGYTERDIQSAAKAFTGWGVDFNRGTFKYDSRKHDNSLVAFMGRSRINNGNQIIDTLLKNPRTAIFIAEKIWREFISDSRPDPRVTQVWGKVFRDSNYDIKTLMTTVLNSDVFWDRRHRGNMVKSPIDLVVGTLRTLPFARVPLKEISRTLALLGQDVLNPPSVKGWDGGNHWIDTQTLLVRSSILHKLTRHSKSNEVVEKKMPKISEQEITKWLLAVSPVLPLSAHSPRKKSRLVRSLVLDPTYQLK